MRASILAAHCPDGRHPRPGRVRANPASQRRRLAATASLICASVKLGALLSGCEEAKCDALTSYGNNIGHAFQVIDDILDVEGSTEELGKTVGADEKIQKMTYPRLYGTEASKEIARRLVTDAVGSLDIFSSEAEVLREIAYYLLGRKN
jgi:geranylgeranyl diphosphate synthase type II